MRNWIEDVDREGRDANKGSVNEQVTAVGNRGSLTRDPLRNL